MDSKKYIKDNRICVVTNTVGKAGGVFKMSMGTYINNVPDNNFAIIPGSTSDGKHNYGVNCFMQMIDMLVKTDDYDYALYIDDDVFVKDFDLLLTEFDKFMKGGYSLAGVQDGGVICHRNGSKVMVNTFVSFWNIKAIRENLAKFIECCKDINKAVISGDLLVRMNELATRTIVSMVEYRKEHHPANGVGFVETVRNNADNPVAPKQNPYSFHEYKPTDNFEPYYILENIVAYVTGMPIMYLNGTDFYDEENKTLDKGCASVVLSGKEYAYRPVLYHTWYSRLYDANNKKNDLSRRETDRINSIYNYLFK